MREIQLTHGQVALVDDEDYEYLNQWKWYADKSTNTFYAKRSSHSKGKCKNVKMHRLILGVTDPKILCDHKDRNGLNNQKDNLRLSTPSQNQANRRSLKHSSSKYLGVTWDKKSNKWTGQIRNKSKGIVKRLGYFNTEIDAALAYNEAAIIIHGEFANLNKVI